MAYALQELLRIRVMREDRASAELAAARQEVRRAEQQLEERKDELRQYEETKEERRDRIYEAVRGHAVTREEIDKVVESVARIDEEGVLKADNVALATANVTEKERLSEEAKTHFAQASKERMKISEHREIWLREELKEEEHRQEIELEDFTGKKNVESLEGDGD